MMKASRGQKSSILLGFVLCKKLFLKQECNNVSQTKRNQGKSAYSTAYSQAVPHPSTDAAQCCLTSVIGREPVFSTWYGRIHYPASRKVLLDLKTWKQTKAKVGYSTAYSQAVPHPSTDAAQCCLTSVIGRELVFSTWYGRIQEQ